MESAVGVGFEEHLDNDIAGEGCSFAHFGETALEDEAAELGV